MIRVSNEDLDVAILWLESYENAPGDDEAKIGCQKVADWLKAELEDRLVKKIMREHPVTREQAKQVLAKLRPEKRA